MNEVKVPTQHDQASIHYTEQCHNPGSWSQGSLGNSILLKKMSAGEMPGKQGIKEGVRPFSVKTVKS